MGKQLAEAELDYIIDPVHGSEERGPEDEGDDFEEPFAKKEKV